MPILVYIQMDIREDLADTQQVKIKGRDPIYGETNEGGG